jgi:hypothetical protein
MEASKRSFIAIWAPWVTLVVGLIIGVVAFDSIPNPFRQHVRVDINGNLPDGEKHIALSITGHHYNKSVRWQSPDHSTLELKNIAPDPSHPSAPPFKVQCANNVCDSDPLSDAQKYVSYSYTVEVTSNGQKRTGTDPWIHVNP